MSCWYRFPHLAKSNITYCHAIMIKQWTDKQTAPRTSDWVTVQGLNVCVLLIIHLSAFDASLSVVSWYLWSLHEGLHGSDMWWACLHNSLCCVSAYGEHMEVKKWFKPMSKTELWSLHDNHTDRLVSFVFTQPPIFHIQSALQLWEYNFKYFTVTTNIHGCRSNN